MNNMNVVMVSGRVAADYKSKEGAFGAMGQMSLAINETTRGKEGSKTKTCWITIKLFGKLASLCDNLNIQKGTFVMIRGKLKQDVWEKDGITKRAHSIIAEEVSIAGGSERMSYEEAQWAE